MAGPTPNPGPARLQLVGAGRLSRIGLGEPPGADFFPSPSAAWSEIEALTGLELQGHKAPPGGWGKTL